jgi:LDH2 family malate/lactate/ureidoglycolate dehydrogenase
MDRLLNELEKAEPAEGCQRVYYAGLKEHEAEIESARLGVQISEKVASQLRQIGEELGVELAGIF